MARLKEPSQLQVFFSSESSCAAAAPTVAAVASGRAGQSSGQRAGQEAIRLSATRITLLRLS